MKGHEHALATGVFSPSSLGGGEGGGREGYIVNGVGVRFIVCIGQVQQSLRVKNKER